MWTPTAVVPIAVQAPRGVHSRPANRIDVIRYCSAWPTSQLTIVHPRVAATGVSRADGPNARFMAATGDAGIALDRLRENSHARPAGTSPVVAIATARAMGVQRA